jgi:hypothetical protein
MHLLGWSNGGTLTYAYANDETRFPRGRRHIKGLIPVDIVFKFTTGSAVTEREEEPSEFQEATLPVSGTREVPLSPPCEYVNLLLYLRPL